MFFWKCPISLCFFLFFCGAEFSSNVLGSQLFTSTELAFRFSRYREIHGQEQLQVGGLDN